MEIVPKVGRIVFSKSGRDMGKYYIITQIIDKEFVLIADGNVRTLSKPKRKRLKHLAMHEQVLDSIGEKLETGKKVYDKELGSAIRSFLKSM